MFSIPLEKESKVLRGDGGLDGEVKVLNCLHEQWGDAKINGGNVKINGGSGKKGIYMNDSRGII